MKDLPPIFRQMVRLLSSLPGIGEKGAMRILLYILRAPVEEVNELIRGLETFKKGMRFCKVCNNITEEELCRICSDPERNSSILCIVENISDLAAIEKTGRFNGRYYVLHGSISPFNGITPEKLRLSNLLEIMRNRSIKEVIIATGLDVEGEATSLYLKEILSSTGVRITRISSGIPMGTPVNVVDQVTLGRAITNRFEIK